MKKILSALTLVALLAACSNENEPLLVSTETETYSVTGYSDKNVNTRTYFYEDWITGENPDYKPFDTGLVFLWHEDDFIWIDGEKSNDITIEDDESATFSGFSTDPAGKTIYYNTSGDSPNIAYVPAEQDVNEHLGNNGDFAYATLNDDYSFTLEHATSYIWFDVLDLLNEYDNDGNRLTNIELVLESITLDAGVNIAGKATWNGTSFGAISEGSSKITLNVGKTIPDTETLFPMVVFPVDLTDKNVNITYKFTVDGETKFYQQVLQGKELTAGVTQLVIPIYMDEDTWEPLFTDYLLRVLTFEDADAKFDSYYLEYADQTIEKWSDLIDEEQHSGVLLYGPNGAFAGTYEGDEGIYHWYDQGNTELMHEFPYTWGGYSYYGGGHAISNYASEDYETFGDAFGGQLTVYGTGGHSGSNFCMHFGYIDYQEYVDQLPALYMGDNIPRVIDHMYVNITTYVLNCLLNGNGLTDPASNNNTFFITATGYDEDDNETGTVTKYIWNPAEDEYVLEWTKWDLTPLGEVLYVKFNVGGTNDNGYGFSQPAYFAYDDVAVQFEE